MSAPTVAIGASLESGLLLLSAEDQNSYRAELSVLDLKAVARVYQLGGGDELDAFFGALAEEWRGWSGERHWTSLEQDLRLAATFQRTGHIHLEVRLATIDWSAQTTLILESGQLNRIAGQARALCRWFGALA